MAEKTYDKIEHRVNAAIPEWKEWARRLRRIYASLEDIGSKQEAIQDAVEQSTTLSRNIEKTVTTPRKNTGSKESQLPN